MTSFANPYRVAIVGSGPAGFFAAESLFSSDIPVRVDMFERLPAPFGLARYGVAPDHPRIRNVIKRFSQIAADHPLSLFANVHVGRDISVAELRRHYDAVILANGAITDKKLNIPGEDLDGIHAAASFAAWYNGHLDYYNDRFDLSQRVAAVIGHGNVALDVARILARPAAELDVTDMPLPAVQALHESRIETIYLIGRRGPVQTAFSFKDLKELTDVTDCTIEVDSEELSLNEASASELTSNITPFARQNYALLSGLDRTRTDRRRIVLKFLRSPVAFHGNGRVSRLVLEINALTGPPGQQIAQGTGRYEELRCGLVLRSIGLKGQAIDGVPYDARAGVVPNRDGRVLSGEKVVPGMYAIGWIQRGPRGLIGTNKRDAGLIVGKVLADLPSLPRCEIADSEAVIAHLKAQDVRPINLEDWRRIDAIEERRGRETGKARERLLTAAEMFSYLDQPG